MSPVSRSDNNVKVYIGEHISNWRGATIGAGGWREKKSANLMETIFLSLTWAEKLVRKQFMP